MAFHILSISSNLVAPVPSVSIIAGFKQANFGMTPELIVEIGKEEKFIINELVGKITVQNADYK